MIKPCMTEEIKALIIDIDRLRVSVEGANIPRAIFGRLRKQSMKRSAYASNKIEGNPLSEKQADEAIESDPHRHFPRPEQEVRNYHRALEMLEEKLAAKVPFSKELVLETQALIVKGASAEKSGLRGQTPPGVLFAVYDSETGNADYIPPEWSDIPELLDELVSYVNSTVDHPLVVAAVVHYQLVTIHPFEDGNGRTARLMSGYVLDLMGYGFKGIGSLEEYFAMNTDEYYCALQMRLPPLYHMGRNNPPHPEIWIGYFLRMVKLYATKVDATIQTDTGALEAVNAAVSHLGKKGRLLLLYLLENDIRDFTPADAARALKVGNRTLLNWCADLGLSGFIIPADSKQRTRSYKLSEFTLANAKAIEERLKLLIGP